MTNKHKIHQAPRRIILEKICSLSLNYQPCEPFSKKSGQSVCSFSYLNTGVMSAFPFVPVISCTYLNHICHIWTWAWSKWLQGTEVDKCLNWVEGRDFMTCFMLVHLCMHMQGTRTSKAQKKRHDSFFFSVAFKQLCQTVDTLCSWSNPNKYPQCHHWSLFSLFSKSTYLVSFIYFFPPPCDTLSPFPCPLPPPSLLTAACCRRRHKQQPWRHRCHGGRRASSRAQRREPFRCVVPTSLFWARSPRLLRRRGGKWRSGDRANPPARVSNTRAGPGLHPWLGPVLLRRGLFQPRGRRVRHESGAAHGLGWPGGENTG